MAIGWRLESSMSPGLPGDVGMSEINGLHNVLLYLRKKERARLRHTAAREDVREGIHMGIRHSDVSVPHVFQRL
ncbi:hypothetical protein TNCV_3744811 [Trichonephila clavipes]|nr:hypothetical protein TNCV_3744811 [Trichonephila clavipes]